MNPYKSLGVSKTASSEEIKKAYRALAKKCHPDVTSGDKHLEKKFKEISEAYEILSDPKKKQQFDRFGEVGPQQRRAPDPTDILNHMFGRQQQPRRHNPDIKSSIRISLEDAIFGCDKEITVNRIVSCEPCKGAGGIKSDTVCAHCNGSGRISQDAGYHQVIMTCGSCHGAGYEVSPCSVCNGVGGKMEQKWIKIKTPKNIGFRKTIRVRDMGNHIFTPNKHVGSLYLVVDFPKVDQGIVKHNNDLHTVISVPIDKIFAEDTIQVNCFGREKVDLKLKSDQEFDEDYKLSPSFLEKGKLYVKVLPEIPSKYVDVDKRNGLVKALREVYGESESIISPKVHES